MSTGAAAPAAGGAASGGSAPASAPASAGGGGAPAPAPQGSGVGTPVAPVSVSNGDSYAAKTGTPAPSPTGPKKLSKTFMEGGKEVKLEASEDALWNSHRREQAVNRKFQEINAQLAEYQKREARMERFEQARRQGRLDQLIPEDMPHADRIRIAAEYVRNMMAEEEALANPETRELHDRAARGDKAARELQRIQQQNAEREQEETALRIQDQMAETFGNALKAVKLPHNDVTVGLMAQAHSTAREMGWDLTPQQLADETMKLTSQTFDAIADSVEDPESILDMFPKLQRKIHEGLLARHSKRMSSTQTPAVNPPPVKKVESNEEKPGTPRIVGSIEEQKAYGTKGLRSI